MLSTADSNALELIRSKSRRPSAVSQALQAISHDVDFQSQAQLILGQNVHAQHRIIVAADRVTRERAYALAHRVYRHAGYASEDETRLCVSPYDASAQTLTLLAQDADGNDSATISLVFDSIAGLPCDEIYQPEVDALRAKSLQLAEVTRLAISETCSGAKELLLHLFNHCYIFARIVQGFSDLLVEVNPRHVKYYQRLLHFEQAGPERPCSRVQGAPAILLRLNISQIEAAVKSTGCTRGRDLNGQRLHPYPYSGAEETAIAKYLAQNHTPMTEADATYFGLDRSKACG